MKHLYWDAAALLAVFIIAAYFAIRTGNKGRNKQ